MVGNVKGTISGITAKVEEALTQKNFEITGKYQPGSKWNLQVITFTRKDLTDISLKIKDRGALASIMKVGLIRNGNNIEISLLNPDYIFYAYFRNNIGPYESKLLSITKEVKAALGSVASEFSPFGGKHKTDKLKKYHYMIGMPYFDDPVELNEFSSFAEGLRTIRKNLDAKKGNTVKVYEKVFEGNKVAVFGVGLHDPEEGEAQFLPIIGEKHIAAMPYEIILMDKTASMLHGRFRIALHWPELTMGTFTKIMSTPGNIEDFLEALTK